MSEMTTRVGKIRKLIEEGAPDAYNFLFTFYNGEPVLVRCSQMR